MIKAYSTNLKAKNGRYNDGVRFDDIITLYLFNTDLRQATLTQIERVEINFRCRLSNYFCGKYSALGHVDANHFFNLKYHGELLDNIKKATSGNVKSPFGRDFRENNTGGEIPLYTLVEMLGFGTLSKFYMNMKNEDKKAIAAMYGVTYTYFGSWIENLAYVRNICVRYGKLYDTKFAKSPQLYNEYTKKGVASNRLYATLLVLKHLLPNDRQWLDFVQTLKVLVEKYPNVELNPIGFPQDWDGHLKQ